MTFWDFADRNAGICLITLVVICATIYNCFRMWMRHRSVVQAGWPPAAAESKEASEDEI
jgi:hypothetical protein